MPLWLQIVLPIILAIAGFFIGIFIARFFIKAHYRKNPPITENMFRAMGKEMGRPFSEAQVKNLVRAYKNQQR